MKAPLTKPNKGYDYTYACRPQSPSDTTGGGVAWSPGQLPNGGYRSMFNFGGTDPKKSPTSKPGNAGGKDII
jgi:hypothetical protein